MNRFSKTGLAALSLLLALGNAVIAEQSKPAIELGAPFTDNAILQRQMAVPVWGWSKPGTKVTVDFAGQKKTASTGKDSKWMLKLDPMEANSTPQTMTVSSTINGQPLTISNILIGEVWLASGQSNMQWKVQKSSCNKLQVEAKGNVAPIREFEVTSVVAMLHPIEKSEGAWKDGDYGNYSAIAFAFAHKLYGELNVPIGILNCSFSQTAIQAWVPRVGFRDGKDDYTRAIYKRILETDPTTPEHKAAWNTFYQSIEDTLKENAKRVKRGEAAKAIDVKTPGNMSGNRDASWLFNGRLNPVVPYAIRGAIWNQGYANMGEGLPYYNNLHSLIRGWRLRWGRPELPVYFHQFYCPGQRGGWNNHPSTGSTAEMRLGTWLARDIPNANMASQIDITGAIHYGHKAVPGQRLALHALKNQYPSATLRTGGKASEIVPDGPMFKSYTVKGSKLIVEFEHAEGGLVVAGTRSNAIGKEAGATGFANPKIIANGDDQVKLFYLADENRLWHPASMKIEGDNVVLASAKVKSPRGVSYATGGVGFQPNLYNKALLPTTPFIYYDNKLVTSKTWPDEKLKIAGVVPDPNTVGKKAEWYKMPLLSTQFRDNAVLQAGEPITIWGSVLHDYGYEAMGEAVIKFSFAGIEKTIPVTADSPHIVELAPGQSRYSIAAKEWRVTVPPMEASAEPKILKVTFLIDGEVAHERVCENIVIGDVWFVAAPPGKFEAPVTGKSGSPVRMMKRKAKRFSSPRPSRYSVCVSRTPKNRFASEWTEASGLAAALGHSIAAKTGKPVGIIFMQSSITSMGKGKPSLNLTELKSWIAVDDLEHAPSLINDYKDLAAVLPGNQYYDANVRRYVASWKQYWAEYIPQMMATRSVPDGAAWGSYPTLASSVTSKASEVYNVMVHSFTPASLKGIIFLSSPEMVKKDRGANFGSELSALANSWKDKFGGKDSHFFYTIPSKALAPKVTQPTKIKGMSAGVAIGGWSEVTKVIELFKTGD
jgi:sialate O-acetylesterase